MTSNLSTLTILSGLALGFAGCIATADDATIDESIEGTDVAALSASVENVQNYASCLVAGTSTSWLSLGLLTQGSDPGTNATFQVAECIASKLAVTNGKHRPFNLQSYKHTSAGQTFILKRTMTNTSSSDPKPECLKIKLAVSVGATQSNVTIQRVKVLPSQPANKLCNDNGET